MIKRDAAVLFTGKDMVGIAGRADDINVICSQPSKSYAYVTNQPLLNGGVTLTHELCHLFGATHPVNDPASLCSDDTNPNKSIMCSGVIPLSAKFYPFTINQINNHLTNNSACLRSLATLDSDGPKVVCGRPGTFFIFTPIPPNATVTWRTSSNLIPQTGQGVAATVSAAGSGSGWVEFVISTPTCNSITTRTNITRVGQPILEGTYTCSSCSPSSGQPLQPISHYLNFTTSNSNMNVTMSESTATSWTWTKVSGNVRFEAFQNRLDFLLPRGQSATFNVSATIPCGSGSIVVSRQMTFISNASALKVSPNPTNDVALIELEEDTDDKAIVSRSLRESNQSELTKKLVFEIYDSKGIKKKVYQTNQARISISMSELPSGMYYIKAISGKQTHVSPLIIQH